MALQVFARTVQTAAVVIRLNFITFVGQVRRHKFKIRVKSMVNVLAHLKKLKALCRRMANDPWEFLEG